MKRLIGTSGVCIIAWLAIMGLGVAPAGATVAGDMAAGLPLEQVFAKGLAAHLTVAAVIDQALDAGAKPCPIIKAALAQHLDLAQVFKALLDHKYPPEETVCTPCDAMKCAAAEGYDLVEVANALMVAGARLEQVRNCLASLGFAGAETYAYSGVAAPAEVGAGAAFPAGGGGTVSPSQ